MFSSLFLLFKFRLYFLLNLSDHLHQFPTRFLSASFLSLYFPMQLIKLFLDLFSQISRCLLSYLSFLLNILFDVKYFLFHFLSDHINCLAFFVSHFLKLVTYRDKFFVWVFDPLLHVLCAFVLFSLNLWRNLILNLFDLGLELVIILSPFRWNLSDIFLELFYFLQYILSLFQM